LGKNGFPPFLDRRLGCVGKEFGHRWKSEEQSEEWRKLHNEELTDLYSSPNIIQVIRSRRMRWAGHVVRMGNRRGAYRVLVEKLEGKSHFEDTGEDGRIILKCIFRKWGGALTGLIWLRIGTGGWVL
jgi:hypothetical protein